MIDYYSKLLIIQYNGKPKAKATIEAIVNPLMMNGLPVEVENAFDLLGDNIAEGVQLDKLAKYQGVRRTYGEITLNDAELTTLIKLAIIKNNSGSSLYDIQNLLQTFFPGTIKVIDSKDMNMSFFIAFGSITENLVNVFVSQNMFPIPMAVGLSSIVVFPPENAFIFDGPPGFGDINDPTVGGLLSLLYTSNIPNEEAILSTESGVIIQTEDGFDLTTG